MFKFLNSVKFDESVYNLACSEEKDTEKVVQDECLPKPRTRYRSIHSAMVRKEAFENRVSCNKTMGVPHTHVDGPDLFLRKQSRRLISIRPASVSYKQMVHKKCQVDEEEKTEQPPNKIEPETWIRKKKEQSIPEKKPSTRACSSKKPPIPPSNLGVELVVEKNHDFIRANAQELIGKSAKTRTLNFVDTPQGNQQEWHNFTGINSRLMHNLGHIPRYLSKRRKELLEKQQKLIKPEEAEEPPTVRKLSKDEIDEMLEGLKGNWAQVYRLYQSMPLLIDTPGKIKRKTRLEEQLKKIEKDMQTFQRHDCIYVSDVATQPYYASHPPK